jgi:hypothetical protein
MKRVDIELRPHHVKGFADYEASPRWYYISDEEYLRNWRKAKGHFHSDKLVIFWRNTIRKLHENPNLKILYVKGLDSVCKECNLKKLCINKKTNEYKAAMEADKSAIHSLPELEFGKVYSGKYLLNLFKKKGLIK